MRSLALIAALVLLPTLSAADSIRERLNAANQLLRIGDIEDALNAYRDIRVDEPESPELQYNIGCAKYRQVLRDIESGEITSEEDPFEEARASFEKALATGSGRVRSDAAFSRANCLAQYAKHMPSDAGQDTLVDAYQQSITAYEEVLRQFPKHEGARKNLDHMRYLLKRMLQNPPPPEDQEGKGENSPEEQQQQQEETPPQQSQNPEQGEEDEQKQQMEQEQTSSKEQEEEDSEQEKDRPQTASGSETQSDEEQQAQASEAAELPDRQTIEALLQSLEDRDQLEQRYERRQAPRTRIKEEWW